MSRGSIRLGDADVTALHGRALRRWWSREIGVVVQDPTRALNPTMRVGDQVTERFRALGNGRPDARRQAIDQLARVGLDDPGVLHRHPHGLSGGQQQRVLLAMAMAAGPPLLILDEPTTGLDSAAEADVLRLVHELRSESRTAVLHVTHDLALARANCDRVAVLHAGGLVEAGPAGTVLAAGTVEPTRRLLGARPLPKDGALRPASVGGRSIVPLVEVRDVTKRFPGATALEHVSMQIGDGEVVGLVGPSGSGKTTLARVVAGLTRPTEGEVVLRRPSHTSRRRGNANLVHPALRMVFQNPGASLNPQHRVQYLLSRALRGSRRTHSLEQLVEDCRLDPALLDRRTSRLSGGQQQRVAIARALAADPALLICDEPVTSLDAPSRAGILDLLVALQRERQMAMLFISHDLSAVEHVADRVLVLRHGRLVNAST